MSTAGLTGAGVTHAPEFRGLVQGACAGLLRRLHRWLRRAVVDVPELADVVPVLQQSVRLYRAGQYEACLAQAMAAGRKLEASRAAHPALPPL
ncbi:hypothetical protein GCM10018793_37460 [Streptomyces sulfonofaciens]|uniref:Uncharacterized protein n=1 Tax=Streptomyces sulfonofaciens TaxID=68272 RepID=A0A919GAK7_9ACTN|nr:hypothetical protein [Streptomyces sulfonofaciens]GHH80990.1 hypothetical protein GCM10018793_37460 [Streptomyces sulfonofaciens]